MCLYPYIFTVELKVHIFIRNGKTGYCMEWKVRMLSETCFFFFMTKFFPQIHPFHLFGQNWYILSSIDCMLKPGLILLQNHQEIISWLIVTQLCLCCNILYTSSPEMFLPPLRQFVEKLCNSMSCSLAMHWHREAGVCYAFINNTT